MSIFAAVRGAVPLLADEHCSMLASSKLDVPL
jgi:hypothetical protein